MFRRFVKYIAVSNDRQRQSDDKKQDEVFVPTSLSKFVKTCHDTKQSFFFFATDAKLCVSNIRNQPCNIKVWHILLCRDLNKAIT